MGHLTVNPTDYTVSDIEQKEIVISFDTDVELTDVKLSLDGGTTYKDKISMSSNSATFSVQGLANNNYTCKLKGYYLDAPTTIPVTGININTTNITIMEGATEQLIASVIPSNATNTGISYNSLYPQIATVSSTGVITGVMSGYTEITATTTDGNFTRTAYITVIGGGSSDDINGIDLQDTAFTCTKGDTLYMDAVIDLTEQYPSYEIRKDGEYLTSTSYDKSTGRFALYNTSALLDGVNSNLRIYATRWVDALSDDPNPLAYEDIGWSELFTITTGDVGSGSTVTGVYLDTSSKTLSVGESFSLYASVVPSNATDLSVTWSSSNSSIAGVSSGGYVSAYNDGTATITVRTNDGGYSATCMVTVSSTGVGGGGSSSDPYDTMNLMYPMPQPHGSIPNGAPSDWKYQSRFENKDKPTGWRAFGGWAQVYRVDGSSFSQNTGVELKDYKVYGWKNNQWNLVTTIKNPTGGFYAEDFIDDAHSSFPSDIKVSGDYSSTIIRLTSSMVLSTSGGTRNVCFHPFTSQLDYDVDFTYIYTCVDMRKVKWDSSGVDDIDTAKYCASCGGDWWREPGLQWAPDWSNNKGIAQPKIMEVQRDWKRFSMTTVPENWTNGFPS